MAGRIDHARIHGREAETEPAKRGDALDDQEDRKDDGEADAAENDCLDEGSACQRRPLKFRHLGWGRGQHGHERWRNDRLRRQQRGAGTHQTPHIPVAHKGDERPRRRVDRENVAGKEQAAMDDAKKKQPGHAVAVDLADRQPAALGGAHLEPQPDAEHEGEQPVDLQRRQPVHEPVGHRVGADIAGRFGHAERRRIGDELDVHHDNAKERSEPEPVGHQRAGESGCARLRGGPVAGDFGHGALRSPLPHKGVIERRHAAAGSRERSLFPVRQRKPLPDLGQRQLIGRRRELA